MAQSPRRIADKARPVDLVIAPVEEMQAPQELANAPKWGITDPPADWDAPVTSTPVADVRAALSLQPLVRLATLAQRMAERYLAGKSGLALENDAREVRALWNELPDEIRVLL